MPADKTNLKEALPEAFRYDPGNESADEYLTRASVWIDAMERGEEAEKQAIEEMLGSRQAYSELKNYVFSVMNEILERLARANSKKLVTEDCFDEFMNEYRILVWNSFYRFNNPKYRSDERSYCFSTFAVHYLKQAAWQVQLHRYGISDRTYYTTKKQAEEALHYYNVKPYDLNSKIKTFSDLYEAWSEVYFKSLSGASSVRSITSVYAYLEDNYSMPIRLVSVGIIKDMMESAQIEVKNGPDKGTLRHASNQTQERIKSLCNLMFDYAVEHNLLQTNPARKFEINGLLQEIEENKKEKIPFSEEDIKTLWENVEYVPYVDMILIGIYTGFRTQELATLAVENVDLEKGIIRGGMKTYAGKNRIVPIHSDIMPLVEKRYKEAVNGFHSEALFNDLRVIRGEFRMSYDKYRHRFDSTIGLLHMEGYSGHCTRHTFATFAMRYGMDPGIRKRILGHSLHGDVTESVYVHPTIEDYKRELQKKKFKSE